MTDWGDDDYVTPSDATTGAPIAFGVDVSGLAVELVDAAVKSAVRRAVATVAQEAVDAALTDDVLEALRNRAAIDAEAAVAQQIESQEAAESGEDPGADATPELYFGSVDEFVREYLRNVYRRRVGTKDFVWAPDWWRYDEAVIRLEALWRAWEHLRLDPATGMSTWFRDHADHHMAVLLSEAGPFGAADLSDMPRPERGAPLPYTAPPEGMFPDVRERPEGPAAA